MVRTEYFASGSEPTEKCDVHTKISVCTESNLPAGDNCPKSKVKEKVFIVRPKDSVGTTADSAYELPDEDATCDVHDGSTKPKDTNSHNNKSNTSSKDKEKSPS